MYVQVTYAALIPVDVNGVITGLFALMSGGPHPAMLSGTRCEFDNRPFSRGAARSRYPHWTQSSAVCSEPGGEGLAPVAVLATVDRVETGSAIV
jgi:hypothetical protein